MGKAHFWRDQESSSLSWLRCSGYGWGIVSPVFIIIIWNSLNHKTVLLIFVTTVLPIFPCGKSLPTSRPSSTLSLTMEIRCVTSQRYVLIHGSADVICMPMVWTTLTQLEHYYQQIFYSLLHVFNRNKVPEGYILLWILKSYLELDGLIRLDVHT